MNVQDIISKALIEYDTTKPTIDYLIKRTGIEGEKTNSDQKRTIFRFFDKTSEEMILETEVEILAVYYDKLHVWSWAWSQTGLSNSENYLAKEILRYALTLESAFSYIKSVLTTSRGILKDITQIDINLAIGASIIKQPYIYPFYDQIENSTLIYYFILLNKSELDKLNKKLENENQKNLAN